MRKSFQLASALALTTFASAAVAADLPAAPVEAAPVYAGPLFDAYFGLGVGYGWNKLSAGGGTSVTDNGFAVRGRATFEAAITDRFGVPWMINCEKSM